MDLLKCRMRLAVLWIIKFCHAVVFFILSFFESGTVTDLMSGVWSGTELTGAAKISFGIVLWITWIMAWAVMTLKCSIIRWTNIVLGLLGGIGLTIGMIMEADTVAAAMLVNYLMGIILFFLIAWYGWKLPEDID